MINIGYLIKGGENMYNLLEKIDFTKRISTEKKELQKLFRIWFEKEYPNIIYDSSYFSDAIFIGNNPSLGLNIVEIISDEEEGMNRYYSALVIHFEKKGYDSKIARSKAKDYQTKLNYLKEFFNRFN